MIYKTGIIKDHNILHLMHILLRQITVYIFVSVRDTEGHTCRHRVCVCGTHHFLGGRSVLHSQEVSKREHLLDPRSIIHHDE